MLAAEYVKGQGLEVTRLEPVSPAPGQVQIAVAFTGICGTDLHVIHGSMDSRVGQRAVIGHEMSGRIAAVGEGVEGFRQGDPVTVMPLLWCGKCATCLAGHQHICERLTFVGIDSAGSLQQLWTVPQEIVIPLPAGLGLKEAALVEPVAVAHHDVTRGRITAGEKVVVIGGGPVGLLIAVVAAHQGADVVVVEPDAFRRSVIEGIGIAAVDPATADAAALMAPRNSGAGADAVFEVSGSEPGLTLAMEVLRPRGRLIVVGIHPQPRQVDVKRIFWRELEIVGARVYERADYDAAIELIHSGVIPAAALISKVVPLSAVTDAFAALAAGGSVMKVLIDVEGGDV